MTAVNRTDSANGASIIYALNSDTVKTVEVTGPSGDIFATSNSSILNVSDIVRQLERSRQNSERLAQEYQTRANEAQQLLQNPDLTDRQRTTLQNSVRLAQSGADRAARDIAAIDAALQSVQQNFDSNFAQLEQQLKDNPSPEEQAAEDKDASDAADEDDEEDPFEEEELDEDEQQSIDDEEAGTDEFETSQEDDVEDGPGDIEDTEMAPDNRADDDQSKQQGDAGAKKFVQVDNPLHEFTSYTYALTLHALNESDFNALVENDTNWRPTRTLIASAGRRGDQQSGTFIRDARFYEDFYFSEFKMTTIVGLNNTSKSTNAIEISFTLLEPNGLTLINRLVDMSADAAIGAKNYLEMPYLLQIDFHGYPDGSGAPVELLEQRKYIPIRIIELKVKVGVGGAEYACRAIPFNHQAFNDTSSATPANFEISGKNLQEFFDSTSQENIAKQKSEREEAEDKKIKDLEKAKADPNLDARDLRLAQANIDQAKAQKDQAIKSATYVSTSYVAAYNAWNKGAQDKKYASDYNEIRVVFAQEILDNDGGTLVVAPEQSAKKTPMANTADPKQVAAARRANAGAGNSGPDFTKGTYNIYMATSVMEVINVAMRNTKFIRDQAIDPNMDAQANADKKDKPIKWWKIVPHIKLKSFDRRLNKYSKVITYYVQVHEFYNRKNPYGPTSMPKGWVKKYSYMYTGQNRDIIDFNIDFDTLYYTAINIDRGKSTAVQSAKPAGTEEDELALTDQESKSLQEPDFNSAQPAQYHNVSELPTATSTGDAKRDSKTQAVAGLANDIYSGSRGDMINVKLKILGDPTFIKQDDIFFNPGQANYKPDMEASGQMTKNNSIRTDTGEIHALLEFYSPTDRDEETGLLRVEGNWWRSLFSGMYRILTIETEMRQGKFEQSLDMIRLFNQTVEAGAPDNYDYEVRRAPPPSVNRQPTEQTTEEDYTQPAPLGGDGAFDTEGFEDDTIIEDDDAELNEDVSDLDDQDETPDEEDVNPEDEDELIQLSDDLEDAEETDITEWDDEASEDPEEEQAVLDDADEPDEPANELVEQTQEDVDSALTEAELNAELSAEQQAELNSMAADLSSDDPATRLRGAEAFVKGPATALVSGTESLVTFNENYIDAMKKGLENPEFQAQATPEQVASVQQAIAEAEATLPKMREAAANAREALAQAQAEIAQQKANGVTGI